jgi:uncharacterized protein with HEPN domain
MLRDPKVLLEDIRLAVADIEEFTRDRSEDDYTSNEFLRAAVERKFIVIGEAMTRLERLDMQWANKITDFRRIVGFRNILVHGYEVIDDKIVWQTIRTHLPVLRSEVDQLAAALGQ